MKQQSAQHDTTSLTARVDQRSTARPTQDGWRLGRGTNGPESRKTGKVMLGDAVDPFIDFLPPCSGWRVAIVGVR